MRMASAEKKVRLDNISSHNDIDYTQANPTPKGSCSPNARFLSDRRHLLNVFPQEVWDLLFEKTEHPKSLECLSNSSLFLRDLLAPQRVQFLFPTVLEIIGGYDHVEKNAISWLIESDICPLKLRSVCLYWTRTIDIMIDNHPFHFYLRDDARTQQISNLQYNFMLQFVDYNTFSRGSDFPVQFLNHFDRTHGHADRNPFLGRSIVINFEAAHEEEDIMATFVPAVLGIIRKYGIHIFYCSVFTDDLRISNSLLYSLVREFLQLMPNLKVFKYVGNSDDVSSSKDEMEDLRDCVNKKPLPTLPSLQMLATKDIPAPVFQELIRSSNNIVTLDISKMNVNQSYTMSPVPLPLLTTFSLNLRREVEIHYLNRSRINWPLTKLFLKSARNKMKLDTWDPVFNVINNFGETLTHLQLELPQVKGVQDKVYDVSLNLPNLSTLSLVMYNATCLDFLLSAKDSLRVFEISIDLYQTNLLRAQELMQEAENGHAKIIEFFSCRRDGLESNVWTLFPNLTQTKFTLQAKVPWDYTRKSHFRKVLGWSCSRREWIKRANLRTL